jgi:hypothetical protein
MPGLDHRASRRARTERALLAEEQNPAGLDEFLLHVWHRAARGQVIHSRVIHDRALRGQVIALRRFCKGDFSVC